MSKRGGSHTALRRGVVAAATVATVAGGMHFEAQAAPGLEDTQSTTAQVVVGSAITLTGLPASFTLTGNPGETVTTTTPVTVVVATNNFEGYGLSIEPQSAALEPATAGNTDTIPIGDLGVRAGATGNFSPLTFGSPVDVYTQATPSAEAGDTLSTEYQITIPFVRPDTYTAVLDYVATTL